MKKFILISTLVTFVISAGAAIMPPDLSTPARTTEAFLRALREMDGEGVWVVMNGKLKDEFSKDFNEIKKHKDIDEFVEEFNAPYLRECGDAHQFLVSMFRAAREVYPDQCAELGQKLSDENIRSLLDSGNLEMKGNKAYLEIEEMGSVSLIKEGSNWKIAELDGFDIFNF
jgi:hypothetical protein